MKNMGGWGSGGNKISRKFRRTSVVEENMDSWGVWKAQGLHGVEEKLDGWGSGRPKVSRRF